MQMTKETDDGGSVRNPLTMKRFTEAACGWSATESDSMGKHSCDRHAHALRSPGVFRFVHCKTLLRCSVLERARALHAFSDAA